MFKILLFLGVFSMALFSFVALLQWTLVLPMPYAGITGGATILMSAYLFRVFQLAFAIMKGEVAE